jgi:type IV secretion system protein VirD4
MIVLAESRSCPCPELATKAARYAEINAESRELNSILSTALTQTRWLDSRPIAADLTRNVVVKRKKLRNLPQPDFGSLKDQPTTIYLILPARRLGSHSTWMRLMIAAILQPLLQDTKQGKVPVMLMLDEYPALARGGFAIIEDNMAMFRGYGIKLWTVFQDLAQARKLYGDGWESFAGNSGVLQTFAPQDVETAEYLSKRTGLRSVALGSTSQSFTINPGKPLTRGDSINVSIQPVPLMLAQDLRNMDTGFSIYFSHTAKGPVRVYLPFELPGFKHIYALDPAVRSSTRN